MPTLSRRLLITSTTLAVVAASLTAVSAPADAATTSVTVVGTSDIYDSDLFQSVIAPGFEAAYPQYTVNYVSKGSGAAIKYAEAGSADALIVHAPSLENQFVGQGYSLEPAGRAVFWGDYVLAGGTADPAGVGMNGAHDIVQAYEDVAKEGATLDANGDPSANFVSRGDLSGTNVQEHQIWAMTTGVTTCTLSAANGGGAVPSTTTGACPSTITYPAWYHVTSETQAPNINTANTCNYPGGENQTTSAGNNCYVFTDRGTFQYLETGGTTANPTIKPAQLSILTQNNAATATGGRTILVNTFHAYAVNPASVSTTLNTAGATALLDWMTTPAAQSEIGSYLDGGGNPPFIPDAAPKVSVGALPAQVKGGSGFRFSGSIANVVPGTPTLSGVEVDLQAVPTADPSATPQVVASDTTDSSGTFSISYTPKIDMLYTLLTASILKIENPQLNPAFLDELQPTSTLMGGVDVAGTITKLVATGRKGFVHVAADTLPAHHGSRAYVALWARPAGSKRAFAFHGRNFVKAGADVIFQNFALRKGKWQFFLRYANPGFITTGPSVTKTVTVR